MADELVAICECRDIFEAQAIRASFEARGVFAHIDGEHHRSMMGLVGSAIALRIIVDPSQLELALELAAEIIPDLARPDKDEQDEQDEQPGAGHSPLRRPPAEDLLAYRDEQAAADDADDEDDDEPARPAKKSIAVALVVFGLGLAVGTVHLYAERRNQGLALFAATVLAVLGIASGQAWGFPLLATIWLVDVGHGIWLLRERNREIDRPKVLLN